MCVSIFLYADDIILLCPSVNGLQRLLRVCERAIEDTDMKINVSKTVCMCIGPRSDATCASLTLCNNTQLKWVDTCKYLGVHFLRERNFRCTFEDVKKNFFSSFIVYLVCLVCAWCVILCLLPYEANKVIYLMLSTIKLAVLLPRKWS